MAMTLDEAIRHCREVAGGCPGGDRQCGYQHDQLADWLEELKAYRATGMTPERVETLDRFREEIFSWSCDRMVEIAQAERDGRLVVLPCKVGDTYYCIIRQCGSARVEETKLRYQYIETAIRGLGKWAFPTRKEAEAALAKED